MFKLVATNGLPSLESTPSTSVFVNVAHPPPTIQLVSAVNKALSISFTQEKYPIANDIISYECSINGGLTYITINQTTSSFQVQLPASTNATYSVILKANNGILSVASNTFTLRKINKNVIWLDQGKLVWYYHFLFLLQYISLTKWLLSCSVLQIVTYSIFKSSQLVDNHMANLHQKCTSELYLEQLCKFFVTFQCKNMST